MSERRILDDAMADAMKGLREHIEHQMLFGNQPVTVGVDRATGPDRTVLTVASLARSTTIVADLERMHAMIPRPVDILVLPDSWINEPLRIEEPLSFLVRRSDMGRLRDVVDFELPFSGARVRWQASEAFVRDYRRAQSSRRDRKWRSRGLRRHVRRLKAAGLWSAR